MRKKPLKHPNVVSLGGDKENLPFVNTTLLCLIWHRSVTEIHQRLAQGGHGFQGQNEDTYANDYWDTEGDSRGSEREEPAQSRDSKMTSKQNSISRMK